MQTNNQIITDTLKSIDIDTLISNCGIRQNTDDLRQYILLYLLEYDTEKLNNIYENKFMKPFIIRMILNQRNYYRSDYNLNYKIQDTKLDIQEPGMEMDKLEYQASIEAYDMYEQNEKEEYLIQFILKELNNYKDKHDWFTKNIFKIKFKNDETLMSLAEKTGISKQTINKAIQLVRMQIKHKFKQEELKVWNN
jgi:hypothetical protein